MKRHSFSCGQLPPDIYKPKGLANQQSFCGATLSMLIAWNGHGWKEGGPQRGWRVWMCGRRMWPTYRRPVRLLAFCCSSLFFLYQALITYHLHQQAQEDANPAVLTEHYNEDCLLYQDSLLTSSASPGVLVFTWRSIQSLQFLTTILKDGRKHAVLVASPDVLEKRRMQLGDQFLPNKLPDLKWGFVNARRSCDVETLRDVLQRFEIGAIHVVYDEFDFLPVHDSREVGAILSCLIVLLESVSKLPEIKVYLHLKQHRKVHYFSPYSDEVGSHHYDHLYVQGATHMRAIQTGSQRHIWQASRRCDPQYDYQRLFDVFQKSVDIYASTFRNIYSIPIRVVVDPSTQ